MICPVCNASPLNYLKTKGVMREGIHYQVCSNCGTIHTSWDLETETENDNPTARNTRILMQARLNRVVEELGYQPIKAIDFGCGDLEFVYFLDSKNVIPYGIDQGAEHLSLEDLTGDVEAAFMVEVIEHLTDPRSVLTELASKIRPGGILYIETTFADQIEDPLTHLYVNPRIGHRTIISRKGLKLIALQAGLELAKEVNPNVVLYRKTAE